MKLEKLHFRPMFGVFLIPFDLTTSKQDFPKKIILVN